MNAEWHRQHRMPVKATLAQRVAWHIEHAQQCACREMPAKIRVEIQKRQSEKQGK